MNYIKHLSTVLSIFRLDDRLTPSHISLYYALFQYWNLNRFKNPFHISRKQILKLSKIGSKSTYHRKIRDLHTWNYIEYLPSHNSIKGSKVTLFEFNTGDGKNPRGNCPKIEQILGHMYPKDGQVPGHLCTGNETQVFQERTTTVPPVGSSINYINNKPKTIYIDFGTVKKFFLKNKSSELEAEKFFNYYESTGWKIGGKAEIKNWQATARNWIIKADEKRKEKTGNAVGQNSNYLHVNNDKDYDIPL